MFIQNDLDTYIRRRNIGRRSSGCNGKRNRRRGKSRKEEGEEE